MKKYLYLIPVAALAMTACTNESDEFVGSQESREISFMPINQMATRTGTGAITTGTFPTGSSIFAAAYDAQNNKTLFNAAEFTYAVGDGKWHCTTPKYWPLSAATINFLAYANLTAGSASWSDPKNAAGVTLTMADNSSEQNDLMYAVGQGKVTQTGNSLTIDEDVDMQFLHAQALLTFQVKATVASAITLKKITLNNAYYSGTLTIDNTQYTSTDPQTAPSATWAVVDGDKKATYDIWSGTYPVTGSLGNTVNYMVVPKAAGASFDSFTLTYEIGDVEYTYTFTPVDRTLAKATQYVYNITFTMHEILIDASVATWTTTAPVNYVDVPTATYTYVASTGEAGTYTLPSATAGTYTVKISGLPSSTYTVVEGDAASDDQDFITNIATSSLTSVTSIDVSFTVSAASGKKHNIIIKDGDTPKFTLTVAQP